MQRAGIANPKIGVCAINPHAGENGLFGYGEEAEKITPAIEKLQADGIDARGPLPADSNTGSSAMARVMAALWRHRREIASAAGFVETTYCWQTGPGAWPIWRHANVVAFTPMCSVSPDCTVTTAHGCASRNRANSRK